MHRGLTSVTFDQRRQMRRWTVGDNLAYSGPLGGDAWIGGPQRVEGILRSIRISCDTHAVALDPDRRARR